MQQLPVVAYVKPTNYCNVGCEHCYLPESVRANGLRMAPDVLVATARMIRDMAAKQRAGGVMWIWHGGEPLVVSPEWYADASRVLDVELGDRIESIQTSLIPYRHEFAPYIHERCNSFVGSSIDFSQRKIKGSVEAYHDLWMRKVEMARADGIRIVPGMVPTKDDVTNASAIVGWLLDRGFDEFNVERYNSFGIFNATGRPSNREHSEFLIGLFDEVVVRRMGNGLPVPRVRTLLSAIRGVLFDQPGDRWGGKCMSSFVVVEPDGSTNNCPDKANVEKSFSTVQDGVDAFFAAPRRREWIRVQSSGNPNDYCHSCENVAWCKGCCPISPNKPDTEGDCSGFSRFLSRVRLYLSTPEGRAIGERYLNV